jgi:hypothetical protein
MMKKMSTKNLLIYLTLLLSFGLAGCDAIYDDEGDCSVTYEVRFRYDMNMKYADAFPHEVQAVTLYVLDDNYNVVWKGTESGEPLDSEDYRMKVNVNPGKYKLLAWCTTNSQNSYTFSSVSTYASAGGNSGMYSCSINGVKEKRREVATDEDEVTVVDHDLDQLYHGMLTDVEFSSEAGTHTITVPLTKDTNRFRIVLQHMGNQPIDVNEFAFEIEADNGFLLYDNSVVPNNDIVYQPWHTSNAAGDIDLNADGTEAASDDDVVINTAVAELSVSRLVVEDNPHLVVYSLGTGDKIFSVPIKDYVLMVKGYENASMSDQEYLDRQDEYNMTFFLDERDRWMDAFIYINSWRVILQNASI